jgi:hypothetical protein
MEGQDDERTSRKVPNGVYAQREACMSGSPAIPPWGKWVIRFKGDGWKLQQEDSTASDPALESMISGGERLRWLPYKGKAAIVLAFFANTSPSLPYSFSNL